jgi:hypothetical protein
MIGKEKPPDNYFLSIIKVTLYSCGRTASFGFGLGFTPTSLIS